jgi:hypothetical protein
MGRVTMDLHEAACIARRGWTREELANNARQPLPFGYGVPLLVDLQPTSQPLLQRILRPVQLRTLPRVPTDAQRFKWWTERYQAAGAFGDQGQHDEAIARGNATKARWKEWWEALADRRAFGEQPTPAANVFAIPVRRAA